MAAPKKKTAQASTGESTRKPSSPVKTAYLVLYNAVSALAWSVVLARTVAIASQQGTEYVYLGVGQWTKWTQTVAALEILHSLLGREYPRCPPLYIEPVWLTPSLPPGIVRAPFLTTIMQVSSRFLLVWAIVDIFPHLAIEYHFYTSMLVAWSVTEVIRYSYFVPLLSLDWQPRPLTWLRYNTFFILYPLGISSECALVWLATGPAEKAFGEVYKWALYAILGIYVPGT